MKALMKVLIFNFRVSWGLVGGADPGIDIILVFSVVLMLGIMMVLIKLLMLARV